LGGRVSEVGIEHAGNRFTRGEIRRRAGGRASGRESTRKEGKVKEKMRRKEKARGTQTKDRQVN